MKALPAIAVMALVLVSFPAGAAIIHVPGDQPTIQAGIGAAGNGDTVLLADGTYTGVGNRDLDFGGKAITVASENGPQNCIIDCEESGRGFYFHTGESDLAIVRGLTISNGNPSGHGGAIRIESASPTIRDCRILNNSVNPTWQYHGGGIYISGSSAEPEIRDNRFTGNYADFGGGLHVSGGSTPTIVNNLFANNTAEEAGGGFYSVSTGTPLFDNNTVFNNLSGEGGGGIYCSNLLMTNTIVWDNTAVVYGGDVYLRNSGNPTFTLYYSTIGPDTYTEDGVVVVGGEGCIYDDPLLVSGPEGNAYLSQTAAGQGLDSPCVDAGDPLSDLINGTTRTDLVPDEGIVDMGFHYPGLMGGARLVTGPGPAQANPPLVRVFSPDAVPDYLYQFSAYGASQYGVKVTCGDVTGDGLDEIITGAGPGAIYGPHVRGWNFGGAAMSGLNFLAYGTNKYGVNVAAGDIDGDGFDEIITGAGPGAVFGPHVRGWNYDGAGSITPIAGVSYFAYGTPKWGVNVSCGDIDGDGLDEIVTGAGPGAVYGPHVRGWDVDGGTPTPMAGVSFLAYATNQFGVNATCGDVDGDGIDEIITGPGPGVVFGAHVRGWNYDGGSVASIPGISFFAWDPSEALYGANVFAGADLDGDGRNEMVVGCGPDSNLGTLVAVFAYDGAQSTEWISFEAYADMALTHGTSVAAGNF